MAEVPRELRDEIPSFDKSGHEEHGPIDWSALTSVQGARSAVEIACLLGLFAAIFFLLQGILVWTNTPAYVFPKPIDTESNASSRPQWTGCVPHDTTCAGIVFSS